MSETASEATRPDHSERVRLRQYRITARLLQEYSARLFRIAHRVGAYLDSIAPGSNRTMPYAVAVSLSRYRGISQEMESLTRFASQMLVHYGLEEAEAAELRLRLKEAERAMALLDVMNDRVPPSPWKS